MIILYTADGNTHVAYLQKDLFPAPPTEGYQIYDIDEVEPDNGELCRFLLAHSGKRDANGVSKYTIENGVLIEDDEWVMAVEL